MIDRRLTVVCAVQTAVDTAVRPLIADGSRRWWPGLVGLDGRRQSPVFGKEH